MLWAWLVRRSKKQKDSHVSRYHAYIYAYLGAITDPELCSSSSYQICMENIVTWWRLFGDCIKIRAWQQPCLIIKKVSWWRTVSWPLRKKISQVQNPSLPLPGGMVFTSLFYVSKSHFILCKMKYNNTSLYIIGIWWGLNKKTFTCLEEEILNYCFRVIELMFFWWK